jgi:hypothetical protein
MIAVAGCLGGTAVAQDAAQSKPIVLRAETVIDGSGKVLHRTSIVVVGSKIQSIGALCLRGPSSITSGP